MLIKRSGKLSAGKQSDSAVGPWADDSLAVEANRSLQSEIKRRGIRLSPLLAESMNKAAKRLYPKEPQKKQQQYFIIEAIEWFSRCVKSDGDGDDGLYHFACFQDIPGTKDTNYIYIPERSWEKIDEIAGILQKQFEENQIPFPKNPRPILIRFVIFCYSIT